MTTKPAPKVIPEIGMGVTIYYYSDRTAATIIEMSKSKQTLILQEDLATRIDKNGPSTDQTYSYERNYEGLIHKATLRKDGRFRIAKSRSLVALGFREEYYDYSF